MLTQKVVGDQSVSTGFRMLPKASLKCKYLSLSDAHIAMKWTGWGFIKRSGHT